MRKALRLGRSSFTGVWINGQMIDQDGFPIEERVEMLLSSDTPLA